MKKWLIIGGVAIVLLTVGLLWLFTAMGWLDEVRDMAIIILAVFFMISALMVIVLLAALVVAITELRRTMQETVQPKALQVMDSVKGASDTARETTAYLAEGVVSPFIKLASLTAGVRAGAKALARRAANKGELEG